MNPDDIAARIRGILPDAQIDLVGADCHFEVAIVSDKLQGQSQLARQRMVLELFRQELGTGALHALSVRAHTSTEVEAAKQAALNLSVR
ncbi:MAG TPA: BolA/IbaG family iron-sulfur metabolism protein [Polyangiales bacterium]